MATLGMVLAVIGWVVAVVGAIMILIIAFKESVGWGLASLFIPIVLLIYTFTRWQKTKKAFLIYVVGIVVAILGGIISGAGAS